MNAVLVLASAGGALFIATQVWAQRDILSELNQLESQGHFREAAEAAGRALESPSLPEADRRQLAFEAERLERIRRDFPFTRETLFAALAGWVRTLTQ